MDQSDILVWDAEGGVDSPELVALAHVPIQALGVKHIHVTEHTLRMARELLRLPTSPHARQYIQTNILLRGAVVLDELFPRVQSEEI
jgi:ribosomal protein S8E